MTITDTQTAPAVPLGLRENLPQFTLLVAINGLVGALVGQERTLVPLLGEEVFSLASSSALMLFIVTFGVAKTGANLAAGHLCERIGRRRVLLLGWAFAVPVPFILMLAPSWAWIVGANILLGVNQGLAWSATVIMKIDLAGPRQRGLAMGLNESAGYLAVAGSAALSGWLAARYGLRPEPFFLGIAIVALGFGSSALFVRDTSARAETVSSEGSQPSFRAIAMLVSFKDRGLGAASRTGLVNNSIDALAWGILPLIMVTRGSTTAEIGIVAATYPAVWGICQLGAGALSDRVGRRFPIALGMWLQAVALLWFWAATELGAMVGAAALLGLGTALVYPALLALVADLSEPAWRGTAIGVYRSWRDAGYVVGGLAAGLLADAFGPPAALLAIAAVTAASGYDAWFHLSSSTDVLNK